MCNLKKIGNVTLLVGVLWSCVANASEQLSFDVANTLEVREITSREFAAQYPREKLVLITARVSLFVAPETTAALQDVVVTLESSSAEFQVYDYFPRTMLDTRLAGNLNVQLQENQRSSLNFDASGYYKALTGAYLTGAFQNEHTLQAQFQMLPPRELVLAAGTVQRGKGVYFKLRATSQTTMEGAKVFAVIARVPRYWRGDLARIRCEAHGKADTLFGAIEGNGTLSSQEFLVALYLAGDVLAQSQAERLISAEAHLRQIAHQQHKAIQRDSTPKILRKVGIASPAIPADWLQGWVFGPAKKEIAAQLPSAVREVAYRYAQARSDLHRLNGEMAVVTR
jgi:hypothetical protein